MADLISSILEIFIEIKFWIKYGKQRKYEKENNLPKKIVWYPYSKQFFILFLIFIPVCFLFFYVTNIGKNKENTEKIMIKISKLLEDEKKQFGKYPSELNTLVRNNPLRKGLEFDSWKTPFVYKITKDGKNYKLISKGGDRKLNTEDDISYSSK